MIIGDDVHFPAGTGSNFFRQSPDDSGPGPPITRGGYSQDSIITRLVTSDFPLAFTWFILMFALSSIILKVYSGDRGRLMRVMIACAGEDLPLRVSSTC